MDSAGHNLGADGYQQVVAALDEPLGRLGEVCRKNNVLLAVTADHGMVFPSETGKGGHSAEKYASRMEALRVPMVFSGPGVEELNLGGRWSEMDLAPTVLSILNISSELISEGQSMPIREGYMLSVTGAPAGLSLWQGEKQLAKACGSECRFLGLHSGLYTLKADGIERTVVVNGDQTIDLVGKPTASSSTKKMLGVILILAINLGGIAMIIRIWRRAD